MKVKLQKVKIHHEGVNILILLFLVLLAINGLAWLFLPPPGLPVVSLVISIVVYAFVCNFFRCPKRTYRGDRDRTVVSSVDGKVVVIEEVYEPEYLKAKAIQVSVFMSPLNVHANWFPVEGIVDYVRHHSGRFLSAYLPKASTENERSTIGIISAGGERLVVRQVAGAMARRIVTYAEEGDISTIDAHLGFIKFGSRADIYLPLGSEILVGLGQRVSGGVTPIAVLPKDK